MLSPVPAVKIHIAVSTGDQLFAKATIFDYIAHRVCQGFHIPGGKKTNHRIIEIKIIYLRSRHHYRYALGHKFHNFRAVRFVAKGVRALRNHTQVRIGYQVGDGLQRSAVENSYLAIQAQLFRQLDQFGFFVSTAVNVKLTVGHSFLYQGKGFDGDVQSLVPLKTARKNNDDLAVLARTVTAIKKARVDVIQENRAL